MFRDASLSLVRLRLWNWRSSEQQNVVCHTALIFNKHASQGKFAEINFLEFSFDYFEWKPELSTDLFSGLLKQIPDRHKKKCIKMLGFYLTTCSPAFTGTYEENKQVNVNSNVSNVFMVSDSSTFMHFLKELLQ